MQQHAVTCNIATSGMDVYQSSRAERPEPWIAVPTATYWTQRQVNYDNASMVAYQGCDDGDTAVTRALTGHMMLKHSLGYMFTTCRHRGRVHTSEVAINNEPVKRCPVGMELAVWTQTCVVVASHN